MCRSRWTAGIPDALNRILSQNGIYSQNRIVFSEQNPFAEKKCILKTENILSLQCLNRSSLRAAPRTPRYAHGFLILSLSLSLSPCYCTGRRGPDVQYSRPSLNSNSTGSSKTLLLLDSAVLSPALFASSLSILVIFRPGFRPCGLPQRLRFYVL